MEAFIGGIPGFILSAIAVIIIFSALILIHELGHFGAAKWFKVKVEEFGMGLPPKAKVLYKKGDTEYTLNWIPFGGFVRMFGEADMTGELAENKGSFSSKPVWQRIIIAAAGVFMNFLLAYVLLVIIFIWGFRPLAIIQDSIYPMQESSYILSSRSFAIEKGLLLENQNPTEPVMISSVVEDSQASRLGLMKGTKILSINEIPIKSIRTFTKNLVDTPTGTNIVIKVLTPSNEEKEVIFSKEKDTIGVNLNQKDAFIETDKKYQFSITEAPILAAVELKSQINYTFTSVGQVFGKIFTSFSVPKDVGGPVQIATAISSATKMGVEALVLLSILLSVNLGVFNILPIPALDGGRILFMLYEVITRRRPNQKVETYIHVVGYVFLLGLIVLVTFQDIARLIGG